MKKLLFVLALSIFCYGDTGLSLDEAIAKVKANNQEIIIAKFEEQIKTLEHQAIVGQNYGSVDVVHNAVRTNDALSIFGMKLQAREATFADFGFKQFNGSNYMLAPQDLNNPKDRNAFQTKIEYTLPLYTGGKLEAYENITKSLHAMSQLDTEALLYEKIYELKKSYFGLTLLKNHLYYLQKIEANTAKLEASMEAKLNEGYVKHVDVLEVKNKRADVARLIAHAKANEALLYQYVSFLVDEPVTSIVGQYDSLSDELPLDGRWVDDTLAIKKAEQNKAIAQMNIKAQESAFLPQVSAFANYGSSDDKWMNVFSKNDAYTAGIQVKLNLFNGGSDKSNLEKARVQNLKASQELELAKKRLALYVKQLQTYIQNDTNELESLKKEVELSRLIYENYSNRYEQKLVSINEVLLKQSEELQKIMRLKEVQNARNEKILELQKIAAKEK